VSRVYVLGGRIFSAPELTTARQDAYLMAQAIDAGVLGFAGKKLDDDTAITLTSSILRSGKLEYLLAGALVEDVDGELRKWTAKTADANAEYFGELTDPDAKAQMITGIVEVLVGFFRGALPSSSASPSVSTTAAASPPAPSTSDAPATESAAPVPAATGAA
jgi:hypothetical protein